MVHPEYTDPTIHKNDLAMLVLERPVEFTDTILPICLPGTEKNDLNGVEATVIGFGFTDNKEETFPDQLMKAQVNITTYKRCREKFERTGRLERKVFEHIDDTNLCAGGEDKRGACNGGLISMDSM